MTRAGHDSTAPRARLALFAKLPRAGQVKTRLVPPLDDERAAALYAAFLEDTARTLAGLPGVERALYLVRPGGALAPPAVLDGWPSVWQAEGDLGSRLERAFAELHERGGPVVIVGSDHPDLPPARVEDAISALGEVDLALAPTPDGGYSLIGTRRFVPGLFEGVEWSSPRTAEGTVARASALGLAVRRLDPWPDVDTWEDLRALAGRLAERPESAPATARLLRSNEGFGIDVARED